MVIHVRRVHNKCLTIGVSIGNYADTKYLVGVEIGKVTEPPRVTVNSGGRTKLEVAWLEQLRS